ncbi:MAG: DNA polymerase [Desulfobulbaceae bacterium]|nr:DNA polymerase [Desulfobulbaceae bacterium]
MREKQFTPSFDVQAAEAFGTGFRKMPWDVDRKSEKGIPVYVYKLNPGLKKRSCEFELVDVFLDETDITYTGIDPSAHVSRLALEERDRLGQLERAYDDNERARIQEDIDRIKEDRRKIEAKISAASGDERKRAFVGYDIETQAIPKADFGETDSACLLSHQFYIAHDGKRIGFVILTDRRFTEKAFTKLIAEVIPKGVRKAYVVAHYSLVEGGWMIEDRMSKSEFSLLFEAASYPRLQAAIEAEIDIVTRIVNAVWDEAKKKDEGEADGKETDQNRSIRIESIHLAPSAKKTILSFRRRRDAVKAVLNGYAKYSIGEDEYGKEQQVPAILLSEHTRSHLRRKSYESVVIEKRGRAWQGTVQQMSKSKREGLLAIAKKRKDEWIEKVSEEEIVGFENTVLLSVMERNTISNLRDKSAGDELWFRAAGLEQRTGKRPKVKIADKEKLYEEYRPLLIEFCDMMHFSTDQGKSLKAFGTMIGIPKLDLGEGQIKEMAQLLTDDPNLFYRYSVRDAIVVAEALAFYGRLFLLELNTPFSTRITGYSRRVFRKVLVGDDECKRGVYEQKIIEATEKRKQLQADAKQRGTKEKIYKLPEENLKHYLGFERTKRKDNTNYWWPGFDMQSFTDFYYGGWNDCRVVGSWGPCVYFDLKSAYPSAVMMLRYDYDFSRAIEHVGMDAQRQAMQMIEEMNPFQIAGVELAYEFRDDVEPIFPIRFDPRRLPNLSLFEFSDQLIYPLIGTTCVGWPEFSVAINHGLLKKGYKVLRLVTYPRIGEGSIFANEIEYLLRMRGEPGKKILYKEICNFLYGQTAMGVSRAITIDEHGLSESKTPPGSLTCIPIAAYCTSFCRAAMGELLALGNPAYAITTDGFISPVTPENLRRDGILLTETDKCLRGLTRVSTGEPLGYEFIEADFVAEQSLFLKTRGYVLVGTKSGKPAIKMAKMGVQTKAGAPDNDALYDPRVAEFLTHLIAGEYPKKSWRGFKLLKKGHQNKLPIPVTRKATLSHSYDFKRKPEQPISDAEFSYGGVAFVHPRFTTVPLATETEFKRLRTESARLGMKNARAEDYKKLLKLVGR